MAKEKQAKKGGGGRLTRSETVTVRLDPKLRYLAELAARKQRRTLSSFIEWAIEKSLEGIYLYEGTGYNNDDSVTIQQEIARLWDVDEAERFARLAILYPELLTHEEMEIWKLLNDSLLLAPARYRKSYGGIEWNWPLLEDEVFPILRGYWPSLMLSYAEGYSASREWVISMQKKVSEGKIYSNYPSKDNGINSGTANTDEDIPF